MFVRLTAWAPRMRRWLSRSEWAVRLLGLPRSTADAGQRGLVLIQIDGLSRTQLECALADGRMPFLRRLLASEHYQTTPFYSGMPSSTPAVQGELFYGVRCATPAFGFRSSKTGEVVTMVSPEAAEQVEQRISQGAEGLRVGDGHGGQRGDGSLRRVPAGERPQKQPHAGQIVDVPEQHDAAVQEEEREQGPPADPPVQRGVERDRAAGDQDDRQSHEQPARVLDRDQPGEQRDDEIHGEIGQDGPFDLVEAVEDGVRPGLGQDVHAREMIGIVVERQVAGDRDRRERDDQQQDVGQRHLLPIGLRHALLADWRSRALARRGRAAKRRPGGSAALAPARADGQRNVAPAGLGSAARSSSTRPKGHRDRVGRKRHRTVIVRRVDGRLDCKRVVPPRQNAECR